MIQPTRTRLGSTSKYSAMPPLTPARYLSEEERVKVLFMPSMSPKIASGTIGDDPDPTLGMHLGDRGVRQRLGAQRGRALGLAEALEHRRVVVADELVHRVDPARLVAGDRGLEVGAGGRVVPEGLGQQAEEALG